MNKVTCVTLSREPFHREVPKGCSYINNNEIFSDEIGLLQSIKNSAQLIDTEHMFICDDDDPLPLSLPDFNTGMIYGDFFFTDIQKNKPSINRRIISSKWDKDKHLEKWYMIHKPIMKTEFFRNVLPFIEPHSYLHTQHAIHYLIALVYGATYDVDFIASWNKHETGLHLADSHQKTSYTKRWLFINRDRIYHELKGMPL